MVLGGETLRGLFGGRKTIINRMTAEMISGNIPSFHLKEDTGGGEPLVFNQEEGGVLQNLALLAP